MSAHSFVNLPPFPIYRLQNAVSRRRAILKVQTEEPHGNDTRDIRRVVLPFATGVDQEERRLGREGLVVGDVVKGAGSLSSRDD